MLSQEIIISWLAPGQISEYFNLAFSKTIETKSPNVRANEHSAANQAIPSVEESTSTSQEQGEIYSSEEEISARAS